MYDALSEYVKAKRSADTNGEWDGNVPANYKTPGTPPKNLGRWVNRQRSAQAKNKLKEEYVTKLEELGLKWTIYDKKSDNSAISSKVPSLPPPVFLPKAQVPEVIDKLHCDIENEVIVATEDTSTEVTKANTPPIEKDALSQPSQSATPVSLSLVTISASPQIPTSEIKNESNVTDDTPPAEDKASSAQPLTVPSTLPVTRNPDTDKPSTQIDEKSACVTCPSVKIEAV